jgi:peptide deformylase
MDIAEMLVQNGEEHDDALHMKGAPVNMRLFKDNKLYRSVIMRTIHLMSRGANLDFDDYPKAQGVSGANVGIPFNIVIVITKDDQETFINPKIVSKSKVMHEAKSNCGSVNLPKPIKVERHQWVEVEWYDISGELHQEVFEIGDENPVSAATLQHEIDHNLGILITDKEVKDETKNS